MTPRAICTAVVVPGAITARVDRVIRATPDARKLIAEADRIGKERRAAPGLGNERRNGWCEPHPSSAGRPFRVIGVSIYCDDLNKLDRIVAARKRAGQSTASRSGLIREAVKTLKAERKRA